MTGLAASVRFARRAFELSVDLAVDAGEVVAVLGPNEIGRAHV